MKRSGRLVTRLVQLGFLAALLLAWHLSTVTGAIQNGMSAIRPAASAPHSLRLELGRAAASGAQVSVRTFKGTIRLRPE